METRPAPFSMEAEAILLKPEIHYSTLLGDYVNFNGYKLRGPFHQAFHSSLSNNVWRGTCHGGWKL
jgi:hypothetical protein